MNRRSTNIVNNVFEAADGFVDSKINGAQKMFNKRFLSESRSMRRSSYIAMSISEMPRFIFDGLAMLSLLLLTVLVIKYELRELSLFISELFIVGVIAQRMLPVISYLYSSFSSLMTSKAHISEILFFLKWSKESHAFANTNEISPTNKLQLSINGLGYSTSRKSLFQNVNFILSENDILALHGKSGSGKSTLVRLLLGLIQPEVGKISVSIDGNTTHSPADLKLYTCSSMCPQSPVIFDVSLKQNIFLGNEPSAAELEDFELLVRELDLDHLMDQEVLSPDRLSGGEKQRVALVRALVRSSNKKLLILDEPTTGLDESLRQRVMRIIGDRSKQKITILISHNSLDLEIANKFLRLGQL